MVYLMTPTGLVNNKLGRSGTDMAQLEVSHGICLTGFQARQAMYT